MHARRNALTLLVAAALSAACGSSSGGGGSVANGGGSSSSGDVAGMSTTDMTTSNFSFSPAVLHGTPGQRLTIHLSNASGTAHNFTLEDQKINTDLPSGKTADVSITFPASGQLVFTCEYHAGKGMKGTLVSGAGAASPAASSNGGGGTGSY
ncbi:MAG: hypothetical protein JWP11_1230 [Frankiales bacterium]|jgi:plastocyanin|nr:hypothetical protein [Frankiales bacterium]